MLRELLAKFGIEVDDSGLKKGHDSTNKFKDALEGIGAAFAGSALIGGAFHFTQGLIELGSELDDQSNRLGVSSDELQLWRHAAGQAGASAEELGSGLKILTKNMADAAEGGAQMQEFTKAGINVKDASGKVRDATDVIGDIAEAIGKAKSNTEQAGIALKFFGKGGLALLPMLKDGKKGIEEITARFKQLGGGLSKEFVKAADDAGDAQAELKLAMLSLKSGIGEVLLPKVTKLVKWLTNLVAKFQNAKKTSNVFKTALAFLGIVSAGVGFKLATGIASKLGLVSAGAGGASKGLLGMAKSALTLGKAGMRSILPWIIAYLLFDDLYTLFTGGDSAIGRFIDGMFGVGASAEFVKVVKAAWADLLVDLQLLWPWVQAAGKEIQRFLKDMFNGFSQTKKDLSEFWTILGQDMEDAWNGMIRSLASFLQKFSKGIESFQKDHPWLMGALNAVTMGAAELGATAVKGSSSIQASALGKLDTGKALEVRNQTIVNVNGAGDPGAVAGKVANAQNNVNSQNTAALGAVVRP